MSIVHITPSTTKMGGIPSVSLDPEVACWEGLPCRTACYAMRIVQRRPTVKKRWYENYRIAVEYPDVYFKEIRLWIMKNEPQRFRWHVGGEILGKNYYRKMKDTARMFPEVEFICFTKNYGCVLGDPRPPRNLTVIFSCWPGLELPKSREFAWAWLEKDERRPSTAMMCRGKCESCLSCFGMGKDRDVVLKVH